VNETGKKKRFLTTTAAADAVWLRSRLLLLFGVFIFLVACTALSPDDFCFFSSFLIFFLSRLNKKNSPGRQPAPAHAAKREGGGKQQQGVNNGQLKSLKKKKKKKKKRLQRISGERVGSFVRSFTSGIIIQSNTKKKEKKSPRLTTRIPRITHPIFFFLFKRKIE
jgi:hypothetical protein